MTKLELIFSIRDEITRQSPTQDSAKFTHPQMLMPTIGKAYESLVLTFFNAPDAINNFDLDYYSKSYDYQIQKDSNDDLYVTLTVNPMPLKYGLGIRTVKPQNSNVQVNRITESEFMSLRNLEAFCCSPIPFCYIDKSNNKIVLQANRREYDIMEYLTVKVIPKFKDISDSDEINTPLGDYELTKMVLELTGIRPTDNTNDDIR